MSHRLAPSIAYRGGQTDYATCSCIGKRPMIAALARKIAKRMARRGGEFSSISAYRCRVCGHWHVGGRGKHP